MSSGPASVLASLTKAQAAALATLSPAQLSELLALKLAQDTASALTAASGQAAALSPAKRPRASSPLGYNDSTHGPLPPGARPPNAPPHVAAASAAPQPPPVALARPPQPALQSSTHRVQAAPPDTAGGSGGAESGSAPEERTPPEVSPASRPLRPFTSDQPPGLQRPVPLRPEQPAPTRPDPPWLPPPEAVPAYARELNRQQQEAVLAPLDDPLLVLAAAGSGKTSVIVRRVQHILSRGVPPKCVLAITFTKAAAEEMQQRLGKALGRAADAVVVSTFGALNLCTPPAMKKSPHPEDSQPLHGEQNAFVGANDLP